MKLYNAKDLRNVAIAGHGGRGKTTIAEAMLFLAGATDRLGRVADGNTIMDFDDEEKRRKSSTSTSIAPFEWKNTKINIIDTPGLFDFAGGLSEGVRAAESTLIVLSSGLGFDVGAEKAFRAAKNRNIARLFAVTRCDAENTDFYKTFESLQDMYSTQVCPVVVPYQVGEVVKAYVNFAEGKAYEYADGKGKEIPMPDDAQVAAMKDIFNEAVASTDDALMEKFFEGEEFSSEEIAQGLAKGVADCSIFPVFACSGFNMDAVDLLMNNIVAIAPSPAVSGSEKAKDDNDNEINVTCDENGPFAAVCFKTVADPFVGKMSYFKVVSGKLTSDIPLYNTRTGETERMGKIILLKGNKQEDTACVPAGDIGVITKLTGTITGDTLCSQKNIVVLEGVQFPEPCLSMAVKVRKKGEEDKVAAGLRKLMEEDPTIVFQTTEETKEQVLSGLGEQHLDTVVTKLNSKFKVEVDLAVPRVAYRETIRKKVEIQGRHKKQSGGHGQFGDVYIRFEPCESDSLVFAEEVVGGSVPKQYFPAVEKGLRESVTKGILAGYPMVGLKATLYFGSYHPVDSSEMAFKTAASIAYKNGIPQASPAILEPIGTLKAYMPDENLGDIMGDITKRRGRVLGMGPSDEPKMQELLAEVPMASMGDFSTVLRSVTAGRGFFHLEFARYEEAPGDVAQKVIEEAKKLQEEEE